MSSLLGNPPVTPKEYRAKLKNRPGDTEAQNTVTVNRRVGRPIRHAAGPHELSPTTAPYDSPGTVAGTYRVRLHC